jgi:hypothetical protein
MSGLSSIYTYTSYRTYLGYHFQPSINFHGRESLAHRMANFVVVAEFEPQGQKTERILERILVA